MPRRSLPCLPQSEQFCAGDEKIFTRDPTPLSIELLALPGITLILAAAVIEPLRAANRLLGREQFSWVLSSPDGTPVATHAGVPLPAARAFDPRSSALPLIVAASYRVEEAMAPVLTRRIGLAGRHRLGVGSAESGTWLLAEAGLLDGRRAALHWEEAEAFEARYPEVEVVSARYVVDGARFSAGGVGATLDLMLELIRARLGYAVSLEVAKLLTYEPAEREASATGVSLARPREPHLARAVAAMEGALDEPWPIARLARHAGVSARHLQTLFAAHFGTTPSGHYQALRLNHARRLLIETALPALEIAERAGFASPASFARAYRRLHGESPSETRRLARGRARG